MLSRRFLQTVTFFLHIKKKKKKKKREERHGDMAEYAVLLSCCAIECVCFNKAENGHGRQGVRGSKKNRNRKFM